MTQTSPTIDLTDAGSTTLTFTVTPTDVSASYAEGRYKITGAASWTNLSDQAVFIGEMNGVFGITGLTADTGYSFESRTKDFGGTDFSAWVASSGTTDPPPAVPPTAQTVIFDRALASRHRVING